jgi:hypothetical protein
MDTSLIDNLEFDGIDFNDYPDFCDFFVISADYDGTPMTEDQLTDLNENYREFCYDKLMDKLY